MRKAKKLFHLFLALILLFSLMPMPKASAASVEGTAIVNAAKQYIGKVPYVWGGTKIDGSNPGADCSGFICRLYEKFGINMWANRTQLRNCGTSLGTDLNLAMPGDIIWYEGHVAIYAGKSDGSHMIVHETGGSYQNVIYSKASIVAAELKGVIHIPSVNHNGAEHGTTPNATVATGAAESITTNSVTVRGTGTVNSKVTIVENGLYLGTSSSNMSRVAWDTGRNFTNRSFPIWYELPKEFKSSSSSLSPGTTYYYKFYAKDNNGTVYFGDVKSFTTTAINCTVTYNANGGTVPNGSQSSVTLTAGSTLRGHLNVTPTRFGYTFDGWYTAASGGSRVTESTVVNSNITLYAHWTQKAPETHYVNFYEGQTHFIASIQVTVGQPYGTLPTPPAKEGYRFAGWFTSSTGGTQVTDTDIVTLTTDQALYAHWTKIEMQSKRLEHGSFSIPAYAEIGEAFPLIAEPDAGYKVGEVIVTDQDTGERLYPSITDNGDNTYTIVRPNAHIWVTVNFVAIEQKFEVMYFDINGAITYRMVTVTNGQPYGSMPAPTRSGYSFAGWFTSATGGTQVTSSDIVKLEKDQILYARWTKNNSPTFVDVKQSDWFYDAVRWAAEQNITVGTSATTFSPNDTCTHVQILTFLWRAEGKPTAAASPFTVDTAYQSAVDWAYEKGMINRTFVPNAYCTRANAVKYIWQAFGSPSAAKSSFTDVPAGADYAAAVSWAVANGVTYGSSATTFSPSDTCTRGHIVTFLHRALAG